MGIIDDITNNSVEELHLSNVPEDYFDDVKLFVDAMEKNTSIKKVVFDGEFLASAVGKERADIVSAVGSLSNVESVILKDSLLMVGICVTNMVKSASNLSDLNIEKCLLQGVPEDFDLLKNAITENKSMKHIHIADCTAANEKVELDKIMTSLSSDLAVEVSGSGA